MAAAKVPLLAPSLTIFLACLLLASYPAACDAQSLSAWEQVAVSPPFHIPRGEILGMAVLVCHKESDVFTYTLHNMMARLGWGWRILILGQNEKLTKWARDQTSVLVQQFNEDEAGSWVSTRNRKGGLRGGRPVHFATIPATPKLTQEENVFENALKRCFLLSPSFYQFIPTEHILMVDHRVLIEDQNRHGVGQVFQRRLEDFFEHPFLGTFSQRHALL